MEIAATEPHQNYKPDPLKIFSEPPHLYRLLSGLIVVQTQIQVNCLRPQKDQSNSERTGRARIYQHQRTNRIAAQLLFERLLGLAAPAQSAEQLYVWESLHCLRRPIDNETDCHLLSQALCSLCPNKPGQSNIDADEKRRQEMDICAQQPKAAIDVSAKGLNEPVYDANIAHGLFRL